MHRNPRATKPAYATAYAGSRLSRVPNQPKTPNRAIRVDDGLWRDFGEACEEEGTTRSDDLRAHMVRKVRAWRKRRAQAGDGEPAEAD
jgi:hypothetical protein